MQFVTALLEMGAAHNRPGTPLTPGGLVVHSTDDPDAAALNIRNYFNNNASAQASAHLAVDWDQAVTIIPWQPGVAEIAWHAGPTANHRYIGAECCESDDPAKFAQGYANFVSTARTILDWYGWPVDATHLFSHAQISALYHETDHIDPLPYLTRHGKTWDQLVADIAAATAITPFPELPADEAQAAARVIQEGASGAVVQEIQTRLKALGFDPGAVDGAFGPQTTAAVMAFQKTNGLTADGVVGAQTLAKLRA